jgi:perosamine synthetase
MQSKDMPRRTFLKQTSKSVLGAVAAAGLTPAWAHAASGAKTPAILGGTPTHADKWLKWPIWTPSSDEEQLLKVMRSGVWSRSGVVSEFEKEWAKTIGVKRALATTNGTYALIIALRMLGIGPGDEVLTTPYTFIATIDAILMNNAMPVFVDVDPETFQIDPDKLEEKITSKTRAILPVHILGLPADMERILAIAKKHDLIVLEDACQAWLAEINHQKIGSFGHAGCYSFQTSKNIPIGEGGAIVSNDEDFMDRAFSFHNFGRPYGGMVGDVSGGYVMVGTKARMTEYQAAIGLAQLPRLEEQTELRNVNAAYLKSQIKDIPGILPYRLYDNVTRAAYHLFPFRYKKEQFAGLSRGHFLKALRAEGVPCSQGYPPLNTMPYLNNALSSRAFQYIYPKEKLDFKKYLENNQCPQNDQLCDEAVWLPQNLLLGSKKDMDDVAEAIARIQKSAAKIKQKV